MRVPIIIIELVRRDAMEILVNAKQGVLRVALRQCEREFEVNLGVESFERTRFLTV